MQQVYSCGAATWRCTVVFDEDELASTQLPTPTLTPESTPTPAPELFMHTPDSGPSAKMTSPSPAPSSVVSLVQHVAAIRAHVDALALVLVSPWELDGAGVLTLFDGVFELSDLMQAIAVRVLPVVKQACPGP